MRRRHLLDEQNLWFGLSILLLIGMAVLGAFPNFASYADESEQIKPIPRILWDYKLNGNIAISQDGSFCAAKNYTHLFLFNRSGLLWSKECPGDSVAVDNLGRAYVEDIDKIYVYNVSGEMIKRYTVPSYGGIITAWDITHDGSYLAVGWEGGGHVVDILRCSDQTEIPWLPETSVTFPANIMIDKIEFASDGNRIMVAGSYTEWETCVIDINGNKLWNITERYEYVGFHPSGNYVLLASGFQKLFLYENGTEVWNITPQNLHGTQNVTDAFDYAYLTENYLVITRPRINIIEFKTEPTKVIWSNLESVADREAMMPVFGNYGVCRLSSYNELALVEIKENSVAWSLQMPAFDDIKLSEYATFVLVKYYSPIDEGYHLRYIAPYPDIVLVYDPTIQKDGKIFVSEFTNFSFIFTYVAPYATVYCSIDGEDFREYPDVFQLQCGDGEHNISYYCEDYYGLRSEVKNATVWLDKTPPALDIIEPGEGAILPSKFKLRVNAGDVGVGLGELRYRVDDGVWYSLPGMEANITIETEGSHTIWVQACDEFNHTTLKSVSVYADLTKPELKITAPEQGAEIRSPVEIKWEGYDNRGIQRYEALVDGKEWLDMGINTSYKLELGDGEHTVIIRATDLAGNQNVSAVSFKVVSEKKEEFPWLYLALIAGAVAAAAVLIAFFRVKK
ncbi:MAG: hypothetical protein QXU48_08360 [Thermoplasmata archaeon]